VKQIIGREKRMNSAQKTKRFKEKNKILNTIKIKLGKVKN
jgi:hypothetical protein